MRTIIYPVDKKYDFGFATQTVDKEALLIEQEVKRSLIGQNITYMLPWTDAADKFISSGIIARLKLKKKVLVNKEKSMIKGSKNGFTYYWLVVNKKR